MVRRMRIEHGASDCNGCNECIDGCNECIDALRLDADCAEYAAKYGIISRAKYDEHSEYDECMTSVTSV